MNKKQSTQQGDSELLITTDGTFTILPQIKHNTYENYQLRPVRLTDIGWVRCSLQRADVIGLYGILKDGLPLWIADLPIIKR